MKKFAIYVVLFLIVITFIRLLLGYLPKNQITFTELLSLLSSVDIDFDRTLEAVVGYADLFKPFNVTGNSLTGYTLSEVFGWFSDFCFRIGRFIDQTSKATFGLVVDSFSFISSILKLFFGLVRPAVS